MSSEGPQALKQSKGDRLKKWFKLDRWKGSRKSSISPATPTSAPSTPKPVDAAGELNYLTLSARTHPILESNPTVSPASSSSPAHTEAEVSSPSNEANTHPGPALSGLEVAKDYLSVTGSFLQLVLKKLPDAVDSNPVKVAFSLAKAVLELKEGMDDNANNVKKRIFATSELLLTVETALGSWEGSGSADEMAAMETFKREVGAELANLIRIRDQGRARRLALQEEDEQQIVDIFDRVDEARNRLMVATTHRIHRIVAEHQREFDLFLHQHLKASAKADHRFHWGQEDQRRTECIPGTRVDIREAIIQWATNTSPDSPSVYWLSGQGGAGKTYHCLHHRSAIRIHCHHRERQRCLGWELLLLSH
ncbi:hypothetical protein BKA70DRAFT_267507 [Coprinopsis sp. MPI-PUGE-AT-0042]|nr:hypothetical protein BKA70DRAFT_267507 [Coprinopsis sp. MPI-PUGE-AT-0042]